MITPELSIIIPCYNEEQSLQSVLRKVCDSLISNNISSEIIISDDASTDRTIEIAEAFMAEENTIPIHILKAASNKGKGFAIRTAIGKAKGDYILIQDADHEYDPRDYMRLLQPVREGMADVVYGSRFSGGNPHRILFFWHSIGNKFLTFVSNVFTNLNLSDMETGYKLFRRDILQRLKLKENRFGFEPEVTARIARIKGIRIYEIGISYYGRTYAEGKKINWKDGFRAIYCILKYNLFDRKDLL